jgi:hypothetical protein
MFPVRYKVGFYISEDDILHIHRNESIKSYIMPKLDQQLQIRFIV